MKSFIDLRREVLGHSVLADVHIELSDLVGIHAGSRDLDWTCPVVVVVAEIISQLLDSFLFGR